MKADLDRYAPVAFGGNFTFGGVNISKAESATLARHLGAIQTHRANVRLISEGEPLERPRLIRSGWACRVRYLRDGRRQILNYYLPGDIMGFSTEAQPTALASYASLTRLMTMDLGGLRSLAIDRAAEFPDLAEACRRMRFNEESYLLSQITRIGRQKAYERVAHLLLEFHSRLKGTGLTEGNTFQLPLTQEALADGLGLSAVHVNRTFKLLKRKNYVRIERTTVTLLEPEALAEIAAYREPGEAAERYSAAPKMTNTVGSTLTSALPA
jgi:CRP-like cAMP-binding protein